MIPDFIDIGSVWRVLPTGIHDATLDEVKLRFAFNKKRRFLFQGLENGVEALRVAGCRLVFIGGSFVTEKPNPGDFDVCWDPFMVDPKRLDRVFFDFRCGRLAQKQKYGGEFFISSSRADSRMNYLEYFQVDKDTFKYKGIVRIHL